MIRIGITMGDPAGVGPEVLLQALGDAAIRARIEPVVFGDEELLGSLARRFSWPMDFEIHAVHGESCRPGQFSRQGARQAVDCLQAAADALEAGRVQALVTGPIHKRALAVGGLPGPGHTEWLAFRFGARRVVMLLTAPSLRVVLATTHVPLRDVPQALNRSDLESTVRLAEEELRRFFLPDGVRLAMCALNPHGEEDGEPGREEREIIIPAIEALRQDGLDVAGPVSGDVAFSLAVSGTFDAVVAMYHDQGLAPLKALAFSEGVNVTLGLGVIRTSPDHGVAYDLAGRGVADPTSMREALRLAAHMASKGA